MFQAVIQTAQFTLSKAEGRSRRIKIQQAALNKEQWRPFENTSGQGPVNDGATFQRGGFWWVNAERAQVNINLTLGIVYLNGWWFYFSLFCHLLSDKMSFRSSFSVLYGVLFEVWTLSKTRRKINKRLLQYVVSKDNCEIKVYTRAANEWRSKAKTRVWIKGPKHLGTNPTSFILSQKATHE